MSSSTGLSSDDSSLASLSAASQLLVLFLSLLLGGLSTGCSDEKSASTSTESVSEAPADSTTASTASIAGPSVEVTILTTNAADFVGQGEWSFAAWVEVDGRPLLFDSGWSPRNVLDNAEALGIDLSRAEELVLSHHHGDHTGGVETLRRELRAKNPKALTRIHVAEGIFDSRPRPDGGEGNPMVALKKTLESLGSEFIVHAEATEIAPSVWITGPVPRVHPEYFYPRNGVLLDGDGETVSDTIPESQSLVVLAEGGPIMISGCGHAGLRNTLDHTRQTVTQQGRDQDQLPAAAANVDLDKQSQVSPLPRQLQGALRQPEAGVDLERQGNRFQIGS